MIQENTEKEVKYGHLNSSS